MFIEADPSGSNLMGSVHYIIYWGEFYQKMVQDHFESDGVTIVNIYIYSTWKFKLKVRVRVV